MERLQKVIASSGYCSRRKAEELIVGGHVSVDGKIVTELGVKVSGDASVEIDGTMLNKNIKKVYYVLNKPRGVVSTSSDDLNRKCVVDLINTTERIYPVGRLDYDTTGLLILTNDGEFANHLMHPKNNIPKTYLAKLEGVISKEAIASLKKGVVIDGRKVIIKEFKVKKKDILKNYSFVQVTIVEGRNHIVKNIFKELGYSVSKLTRISYGFLLLDNLKSGEYRELSIKEVKKFYSM